MVWADARIEAVFAGSCGDSSLTPAKMNCSAFRSFSLLLITMFWACVAASAHAQGLTVGAGSRVSLGNATVDLNCNDLVIEGGGAVNAQGALLDTSRHLTIQPAGLLEGGSSTIRLSGTWTNDGTFIVAQSSVRFYTGCGVENDVQGSSDSDGDGIPDGEDFNFLIPDLRIPTFDSWATVLLIGLLAGIGWLTLTRRTVQPLSR
jgi:hypothetical protein